MTIVEQARLAFDYDQLDTETRIVVQQRTGEIRERIRQTAQGIVEIGQRLREVKDRLPHGQFGPWLRAEFGMTEGHARKMMQVAKAFADQNDHYDRFAPTALYLLAAPATPEEAREEALERAAAGETITPRTAEQIIAAHMPPAPDADDEAETLTPYEAQIAAQHEQRLRDEVARQAAAAPAGDVIAEADVVVEEAPKQTAPASPVTEHKPATGSAGGGGASAAPTLTPIGATTHPPLMPLTPQASPTPTTSGDTAELRRATALVALLHQALNLAEVELDQARRACAPAPTITIADAAVEQAARVFIDTQAVRASANFLSMSAQEVVSVPAGPTPLESYIEAAV